MSDPNDDDLGLGLALQGQQEPVPTVRIRKLHPDAQTPTYASDGAAAFDIYALEDAFIQPASAKKIRTGLAFEVPAGYVMHAYSRSGHGFKDGVRLVNCVGVIDCDYRGEVMVGLHNDGSKGYRVDKGDRIAQAIVQPVTRWTFEEVEELSETARGDGGFGSSGA